MGVTEVMGIAALVAAVGLSGWSIGVLRRGMRINQEAADFYAAGLRTRQEALDLEARAIALRTKRETPTWFAAKRRRPLWVHLVDDTTVKGLVADVSEEGLLLEEAEYLGAEKAVGLGGRIWLPKERINFTQVPPAPNGARP